MNLKTLAHVCLSLKIFPAPAETLVAAEKRNAERAERQQVCTYKEIPEVEPCSAVGKRNKARECAVAESRCESEHECAESAYKAALGAAPAGHFAHAGKDVLKYRKHSRERCENHEQEEHCTPPAAAAHMIEYRRHSVKKEARTGVNFNIICKACRENYKTCNNRNECVEDNYIDRFAEE